MSLVIRLTLLVACCCASSLSFRVRSRRAGTVVGKLMSQGGSENAYNSGDRSTLISFTSPDSRKDDDGIRQYLALMRVDTQIDDGVKNEIALTSKDVAENMRGLLNEVLKMDQSQLLGGPLYDVNRLKTLSSVLSKHIPDMNHNEVSNVIWGFGTLMKNRDDAIIAKQEKDSVVGINYRIESSSISGLEGPGKVRESLKDLVSASIFRFHDCILTNDPNRPKSVYARHVSKLIVGIGRMAKTAKFSFDELNDDVKRAMLGILHYACEHGLLLGSSGQPLANVFWALSQMGVDFWVDLTTSTLD